MTGVRSAASGKNLRAFNGEASLLARALRSGRLTVLVGASGVGKTTLLLAEVLPLLRRRVGDDRDSMGGASPVVMPFPDRRSRVQGRGEGELLHFVDRWNEPSLDLLARALGEVPAPAAVQIGLPQAMSPAHLSALSQRRGGARLLFVFDHFELLIEGARHNPDLESFLTAWGTALQAPDLDAHFLLSVEEQAWPRMAELLAPLPAGALRAFRLQERSGRRVLESLTDDQSWSAEAEPELTRIEFQDSIGALLSKAAQSARSAASRPGGFEASLSAMVSRVSSSVRGADPSPASASNSADGQSLARGPNAESMHPAVARTPAPDLSDPSLVSDAAPKGSAHSADVEGGGRVLIALQAVRFQGRSARGVPGADAEPMREEASRATESGWAAKAAEATREVAAARAAAELGAELAAEAQRVAQTQLAAEVAKAAEAGRRAQAAEAAAAHEMKARQAAEATAAAAQAERLAEAALLAEAKRRAEDERRIEINRQAHALRQAEEARQAEARKLAQALAAAEAAAARERQARQAAEAAAKAAADQQWAEAVRRAEAERRADEFRQAEAAQRAETQRLTQALAAAEASSAREAQRLEPGIDTDGSSAAGETQSHEAADRQPPALEEPPTRRTTISPMRPRDLDAADGRLAPDAATARPVRSNLVWRAGALAVLAAAVLWWFDRWVPPATPIARSTEAAAPLPGADSVLGRSPASADASAPPLPGRYELVGSTAGSTHSRLALELAGALSNKAQAVQVVPAPNAPDAMTGLPTQGRLAVVRFDTLRAARGTAAEPLRVLTPLFPQEVLFIVRADSPLKYIHELRGQRLGIGPAPGDDALTVRAIYRSMFDAEMIEPTQVDNDQAVAELVAFRSIDAMAVVEPQPSVWWASLGSRTKRQLRLLTLDARHPADQRLLQTPGTSRAPAGTGSANDKQITTPAVMSFLVTSGSGDADAERMKTMAAALCRELPRLRKSAHPKWRELQTKAELDSGWPVDQQFRSALDRCMRR